MKEERIEGLFCLKKEHNGSITFLLAYNGKPTRYFISKEEHASLKLINEALKIKGVINEHEGRRVLGAHMPNEVIQEKIMDLEE